MFSNMWLVVIAVCLFLFAHVQQPGATACEFSLPEPVRFPLFPTERPWKVPFPFYAPPEFSIECDICDEATPFLYKFHSVTQGVDRRRARACLRRPGYAFDSTGYPLNPAGRTGLRGRGLLPRWGPNHVLKLILTRKGENGTEYLANTKTPSVLPATYANDIKGVWFDKETTREIVITLFKLNRSIEKSWQLITKAQKSSQALVTGSVPAPMNTDNAWVELHVRLIICENHPEYCAAVANALQEKGFGWMLSDEPDPKKIHTHIMQHMKNTFKEENLSDYSAFCKETVLERLSNTLGETAIISTFMSFATFPVCP